MSIDGEEGERKGSAGREKARVKAQRGKWRNTRQWAGRAGKGKPGGRESSEDPEKPRSLARDGNGGVTAWTGPIALTFYSASFSLGREPNACSPLKTVRQAHWGHGGRNNSQSQWAPGRWAFSHLCTPTPTSWCSKIPGERSSPMGGLLSELLSCWTVLLWWLLLACPTSGYTTDPSHGHLCRLIKMPASLAFRIEKIGLDCQNLADLLTTALARTVSLSWAF